MRFQDRAERITAKQIAETFVSVGPLLDLLGSSNNQVIYGRRGTGKTHALRYFQSQRNGSGDIALYIDGQNLGSNGSIYNDTTIPISERATRLLVDVCSSIHQELLEIFTDDRNGFDLSTAIPVLNEFVDGFTETRVVGSVEKKTHERNTASRQSSKNLGAKVDSSASLSLSGGIKDGETATSEDGASKKISGSEERWVTFAYFSKAIRNLAEFLRPRRLWILIDEWTTVPAEIQPYLADLIRRSMFSVPNVTVKIAAIEHRVNFKIDRDDGGYVGFEVGADISASINLDDYLVVDNNEERARDFFKTFIRNHALAVAEEMGIKIDQSIELSKRAFTQDNVFTAFVRASEGVPRDAMHIISLAAQKADTAPISMPVVLAASYAFFQTEKYTAIQSNPENRLMLEWIRDEVIGSRRTRAFLLPVDIQDPIIDRLFDRRALHILNRNRSAAHRPGERFIVYKLDYGLYVDLYNTDRYPEGLLIDEEIAPDIDSEVPLDDARSYRRAILDLQQFYAVHKDLEAP